MPEVTENGFTFFRTSDLDEFREINVTGNAEDTVVEITFLDGINNVTLKAKSTDKGDPDEIFNDEISVYQFVEDDYIENNPGTINNKIISYVGHFFSDTVKEQSTFDEDS